LQAITLDIIQSTFNASNEGRIHFGQVIGQLSAANVESYHVDYRAGRSTYYLPDGETMELAFEQAGNAIATFDAEAVRSAIRGAQQGKVMYPEFKRLSERGGCVGYIVWIAGRHVSYFGRNGETHIESFPD
jgi:uncharacterized protein YbcV (DUF1398 family)